MSTLLITGGAGFIGSHVVRRFVKNYPDYKIVNLDKLTYAGNLENLTDIEQNKNYEFVKGDIADAEFINSLFKKYRFDSVIHLAAESHVDRSIISPLEFVITNVVGTVNLLNAAKTNWQSAVSNMQTSNSPPHRMTGGVQHLTSNVQPVAPLTRQSKLQRLSANPYIPAQAIKRITSNIQHPTYNLFYHISTDEVYGSLGKKGYFTESTPYDPHSPYSASKAGSDHFVRAYHDTYKLPVIISNCSNNYGPNQFPEKLIPLCINNIKNRKPLPIYGKGENVRDWLYVEDHAAAIDTIFHKGKPGETYNIGGDNEWMNIDLVCMLCRIMDQKTGRKKGESEKLITYVKDRAGHDLRYAIDSGKLKKELGWKPQHTFETGLEKTVEWYLGNEKWLNGVTSGTYQKYYKEQYIVR